MAQPKMRWREFRMGLLRNWSLYSWRYAYVIVFILVILCIALAIVFFENHNLKKKIPLYQLDIPGLLLLIVSMMLINYVVVYGKVEDWFNSAANFRFFWSCDCTIALYKKRVYGQATTS
jgi:DHA2 family multidrug resistance protein